MIVNRLGQGGMASLYLARDPAIDRLVAIKVLREGFDSPELRERFAREARAAGRLHHVNIVTIFDVGEHQGEPFIAMEYIAGDTLAQIIRRHAEVSLSRKLGWLEALCAGLGYAHQAGIVHRDIKPANIMVGPDGVVKVLDFGIARAGDSSMTQAGMLVGTLNYMSPEQVAGAPVGPRSDIFAVGAVAYELISYRQAFPGNLQTGILHRILSEEPEPLDAVEPAAGAELAGIVARALAKKPGDRYPDLAAMRRDLLRVRRFLPADEGVEDVEGPTLAVAPPTEPLTPRSIRRGSGIEDITRRRALQIEAYLTEGRQAEEAGDLQKAVQAADQALMIDPQHSAAQDLMERARAGLERRRLEEALAGAAAAVEREAPTEAELLLEAAAGLGLEQESADASRLRREIARLRELREQGRVARDLVARGRARLLDGSPESAVHLADEALRIGSVDDEARELRSEAVAAIDARQRAEAAAAAETAVRQARERAASGQLHEAVADLEAFQPAHPIVERGVVELRAQIEAEERRRVEAEDAARRDAERARQAREARAAALVGSARKAASRGAFEDALAALLEAERFVEDPREVHDLSREVEAARAAAETAREREQEAAARVSQARQALRAGDLAAARAGVDAALASVEGHAAARKLQVEIERAERDAAAAVDRARRRDEALAEAAGHLAAGDLGSARGAVDRALAADAKHADARRLEADIASAEAEARRAEAARRKIEAAVDKARRASTPKRMLARAKEVLALEAGHPEALELLRRAEAELAALNSRATAEDASATAGAVGGLATPAPGLGWAAPITRRVPALALAAAGLVLVMVATGFMLFGRDRTAEVTSEEPSRADPVAATTTAGAPTSTASPAEVAATPGPDNPISGREAASAGDDNAPPRPAPAEARREATSPTTGSRSESEREAADLKLANLRKRARDSFGRGEREGALESAAGVLALDPEDGAMRALVSRLLEDAQAASGKARDAATSAGAPARARDLYQKAQQAERQAGALRRSGKNDESVRGYWQAASVYTEARAEAARAAAAEAPPASAAATGRGVEPAAPARPPSTASASPPPARSPPPPAASVTSPPAATPSSSAATPPRTVPEPPAPKPTPAASAPAATAPSAAEILARDQASVRNALDAYRAAFESLDAAAVARVHRSLSRQQVSDLTKSFREYRSSSVEIQDAEIRIAGDQATVSCRVTRRFVPKAGSAIGGEPRVTVFQLQRAGSSWVITGVSER